MPHFLTPPTPLAKGGAGKVSVVKCSESSIRNWEKGRTIPMMEVWQVFRLRDLYQCTEEELVQAVKESMLTEETQP